MFRDAATDSSPGSVGLFWKKMKPLLPNRKPNAGADTIHLIEDGKVVSDPSSTFNEYISTPAIFEFELSLTMEDFENHPSVVLIRNKSFNLDFSFEPVMPAYVADLLIGLNVKKSCGPDGLSPKILEIAAPAIISPLTKLINFCIESAQWPKQWKLSNVSPVYKKEEETIR